MKRFVVGWQFQEAVRLQCLHYFLHYDRVLFRPYNIGSGLEIEDGSYDIAEFRDELTKVR